MNEFVLSGPVKRRAQLAGDIENTHEALRKMVLDLESLDATIVQFDPHSKVEAIKPKAFPPPKDWSNRGQMSRIVLSILRQAAEPLISRDIAFELLVERAFDKSDQRLLRLMSKRVGVALCASNSAGRRPCAVRTGAGAVHVVGSRALKNTHPVKSGGKHPYGHGRQVFRLGISEDSLILGSTTGATAPLLSPFLAIFSI
jgi:hypothetical protein